MMDFAQLQARIIAAMGFGCAVSAGCDERPQRSRPPIESASDASRSIESLGDRGALMARPLPPGWRAVDGGYAHTVVRSGGVELDRSPSNRGYTRVRSVRRITEEVFTTTPPSPLETTSILGHSGGGCEPTTFCVHGERATPASADAVASAARCAQSSTVEPQFLLGSTGRGELDIATTREERQSFRGDVCCYQWHRFCGGGRLLLREGRAIVPETVERGRARTARSTVASASIAALSLGDRARLAAHWAREASFEQASIASFADALGDLTALSAPASLIDATRAAARDEARHARVLYALASALAGVELGPRRAPIAAAPAKDLVSFARALFVEACVNETIAVAQLREAIRAPEIEPTLRDVLRGVVEDELAHMELAWRTLAWCVVEGGDAVRDAIEEELGALLGSIEEHRAPPLCEEDVELLARWGITSAEASERARFTCVREVVVPCARVLVQQRERWSRGEGQPEVPASARPHSEQNARGNASPGRGAHS
jgi:hypothetical protein